ncbi:MAG: ThuA domain-containing protein, partial [Gemmataceae bacterium]|nr:ThuA domain-containing protein [Gemmataceae bacterium]
MRVLRSLLFILAGCSGWGLAPAAEPKPLKILFLGDRGPHRPADRFRQLHAALLPRGIHLTYAESADVLRPRVLADYDGLLIYANIDEITPDQEKALLDFVAGGKGFIPVHCASYCFRNSPRYIELVGAQFQRHDAGIFRTSIVAPDHPIMRGFGGFESWDETYVHTHHNDKDRVILEKREDEPWTWVRTHGRGRVFYTAWGHDHRTFGHPGFHNLVERGIRWACGDDPARAPTYRDKVALKPLPKDVKPFEYVPANVPFYPKSDRWGVTGEPIKQMQKPLPPEESMKHITTPPEFDLKLFVDESKLGGGKPICMTWDERGRLWLALTYDYPNELQPEGEGRDRIVICHDDDGDGACDRVTVFADKLSIPTSILRYRDGLIVAQAPHTLFLRDTDGDDVCDQRQVLFTGWGTQDTHAGPSNLRYGLDNWIYGIVGYSGFRGTVGGEAHRFSQGFFRFKVESASNSSPNSSPNLSPNSSPGSVVVTKLEFLRSTNNNSWGVGISDEGLLFGSTANGCPSVFMPLANRYYEAVKGWSSTVLQNIAPDNHFEPITDKVRQVDWHGGFTAAAGSAIYTARNYPPDYWNRVQFVCEPTGHLVAMFQLSADGAGFRARYWGNLLASDDEWCAPIMAEVGPDGNVWVLDWYNFIVQHNPTPPGFRTGKGNAYETDLRDKKHGRVYRVVATTPHSKTPSGWNPADPADVLRTLTSDNQMHRLHAQRLLVEGRVAIGADSLLDLVRAGIDGDERSALGAVQALGALHGLQWRGADPAAYRPLLAAALKSRHASLRRNAVLVLPRDETSLQVVLESGLLGDTDPQVRLAALQSLAELPPSAAAAEALARLCVEPTVIADRWLRDGLIAAAARNEMRFLEAVTSATNLGNEAREVVSVVAEHAARSGLVFSKPLLENLARTNAKTTEVILSSYAKGWPKGSPLELPAAVEEALLQLFPKATPAGQAALLRLSNAWGSRKFAEQAAAISRSLLAVIGDADKSESQRIAAVRQLAEILPIDEATARELLQVITPQSSPALNEAVLEALSSQRVGAQLMVERANSWSPVTRAAAVRALLSRIDATKVLLDGLEQGSISLADLALDQREALARHTDRAIADRARTLLSRGGGLPNPDRQKVLDELLPVTKRQGNVEAGRVVYKNNCAKCHVPVSY